MTKGRQGAGVWEALRDTLSPTKGPTLLILILILIVFISLSRCYVPIKQSSSGTKGSSVKFHSLLCPRGLSQHPSLEEMQLRVAKGSSHRHSGMYMLVHEHAHTHTLVHTCIFIFTHAHGAHAHLHTPSQTYAPGPSLANAHTLTHRRLTSTPIPLTYAYSQLLILTPSHTSLQMHTCMCAHAVRLPLKARKHPLTFAHTFASLLRERWHATHSVLNVAFLSLHLTYILGIVSRQKQRAAPSFWSRYIVFCRVDVL